MNQMLAVQQDIGDDVAKVVAIIAQQAMIDDTQITPETLLADLALDSLVMVEIVFALEEAFDVTIPFNAHDTQGYASTITHSDSAGFDMSTPLAIATAIRGLRAA